MRTTKTSPRRLWVSGQLNNPVVIELTDEELQFYGIEENIDIDETINERERPIFSAPEVFNEDTHHALDNLVLEANLISSDCIDIYLQALNLVTNLN